MTFKSIKKHSKLTSKQKQPKTTHISKQYKAINNPNQNQNKTKAKT